MNQVTIEQLEDIAKLDRKDQVQFIDGLRVYAMSEERLEELFMKVSSLDRSYLKGMLLKLINHQKGVSFK